MDKADEERFRQFVAGRSDALLRTAYLLMGDLGKAEDLLQTALVKTYLSWGRIKHERAVEAYTRKVMTNTATSWWRRKWSAERPTDILPESAQPDASASVAEAQEMRHYLSGLPARQRAVLVLRFFADLSEAQVAEELGISRGAVSGYANRGLNTLRERMLAETSRVYARPDLSGQVALQGKQVRRGRQRIGVAATGVAVLIAVLALVVTLGGHAVDPTPAETPTPSVPVSPSPAASPSMSVSPSPQLSEIGDPTTFGVLRGGAIVTGGRTVTLPAPIGAATEMAERVAGGWLLHSPQRDRAQPMMETWFLTDGGSLRAFQPALVGSTIAIAADGTRMVAYVHPSTFQVFALPAMTKMATFNTPAVAGGSNIEGLWLAGDRVVTFYRGSDHGGKWNGTVVHNLSTQADTIAADDLQPAAISADGRTVLLNHSFGFGPDAKNCVSFTTLADRISQAQEPFCPAGFDLGNGQAALSADGAWLAIGVSQRGSASSEIWVYRSADVRAGGAVPVRKISDTLSLIGWLDGPRILVAEWRSPLQTVRLCPVGSGSCAAVPQAVGAKGIVISYGG